MMESMDTYEIINGNTPDYSTKLSKLIDIANKENRPVAL